MEGVFGLRSTFLFAMPSAVGGAGRLFDFAGTMTTYNESRSPEEADAIATTMDWLAVGEDLDTATRRVIPAEIRERVRREVRSLR
jgi:hypothetical protein